MKILIYGAGVIGSLYAVLLSDSGVDTAVFARGARLEFLEKNGLLYLHDGEIKRADKIKIVSEVNEEDSRVD